MFNLFIIVTAGILLLLWAIFRSRRKKPVGLPPGPVINLPFLGYLPLLGKYPWQSFLHMKKKYGPVFSLYMGPHFTVILNDYDSIKEAYVDHGDDFLGRPDGFITKLLSSSEDGAVHGILQQEPPAWHSTHGFIRGVFGGLEVGGHLYEEIVLNEMKFLVKRLQEHGDQPFDPNERIFPATYNMGMQLLMGCRLEYGSQRYRTMTRGVRSLLTMLGGSIVQFYPILRYFPGSLYRQWREAQHTMQETRKFVQEQLDYKESRFIPGTRAKDFMETWIEYNRRNGDKENRAFASRDALVSNTIVLLAGGGEPSSVALIWMIYHMCKYPEIQSNVQLEIDQVVGRANPVGYRDQERLPYTTATYHEFMRLGGHGPLGPPRATVRDTTVAGYFLPARTQVFPNLWGTHRDPKYFPEPNAFRPERYLQSDGKVSVPPQLIHFSMGERSCPGREIARIKVFVIFANLLRHFQMRTAEGTKLPPDDEWQHGISARPLPFKIELESRI